ncbi:hypothetical protein RND81_05G112200 [Saponaria officinalis]|uniref:Uncharacterized protein n=1 Tax=Saponaria officinalis TaxID=3572 RepID=A0AAW1KVH1_SAPOF
MADEQQIGYIGLLEIIDNSAITNTKLTNPTTDRYEQITRSKDYDNQTGTYVRGTAKESYSTGDYSNRGRAGYKDEYKTSFTVRVGDKRGYTEYYKQEKVTRVEYDDTPSYSSGSGGGGGGKRNYYGGGRKGYKSYGGGKKYLN